MNLDIYKKQAAARAAEYIQSGMVVGLGTGSTAVHLVRILGEKLAKGELVNVVGIPTSEATAVEAQRCNVPLTDLSKHPRLDITIDGADEVDPNLNLIKGLGGALLREKIVAAASRQMIVIGDITKKVSQLGSRAPVPVEVIPFAQSPVFQFLAAIHANPKLRMDKNNPSQPFITDEGNIILDCFIGPIDNPQALAQTIIQQPGVVEHGLFLGMAARVILAGENGIEELHNS